MFVFLMLCLINKEYHIAAFLYAKKEFVTNEQKYPKHTNTQYNYRGKSIEIKNNKIYYMFRYENNNGHFLMAHYLRCLIRYLVRHGS